MVLTSHSIRKSMNKENATSFDIKVALLGHVSVGKTTVLNALFGGKYSEVSMRRTTAGINHFRVNYESVSRPAEQILDEITEDNKVLREETSIEEKFFDVVIEGQVLTMRKDTNLVIVDIPGLNEAGSRDMYLKYVKDSWDTFDGIIVVMDAALGVNSEEQVNLLRFVKENMDEQKQVPVIVLCNKVDDPDDAEVVELVNEVEEKVANMFPGYAASNKNKKERTSEAGIAFIPISAGNAFMYRAASSLPLEEFKRLDKECIDKIGHEECGKFRWKRLSREKQYELVHKVVNDPAQFEERLKACNFNTFLGTLEAFLGGKENQKYLITKQLQVILSNLSHDTGFTDKLCSIYDRSKVLELDQDMIGLRDTFWKLYDDSEKDATNKFDTDPTKVIHLSKLMDELTDYSKGLHVKLFSAEGMPTVRKRDAAMILEAMKRLIRYLCGVLMQKESAWDFQLYFRTSFVNIQHISSVSWEWRSNNQWYNAQFQWRATSPINEDPRYWQWNTYGNNEWYHSQSGSKKKGTADVYPCIVTTRKALSSWAQLSPYDWDTIVSSILLMKHRQHFCEHFGTQIVQLERLNKNGKFNLSKLNDQTNQYCSIHDKPENDCCCPRMSSQYAKHVNGKYLKGSFVPDDKKMYRRAAQIHIPRSPQDDTHWGHLIWKFCEFMDSLKENNVSDVQM